MPLPSFLHAHPPGARLYLELTALLEHSDLGGHAATLALRGVLHAAAWLSEDPLQNPFHATVNAGQIHYHHRTDPVGLLAIDVHRAVLFNGTVLSCTGLVIRAALRNDADHPCQQRAASEYRQLLRLYSRHGLYFQHALA